MPLRWTLQSLERDPILGCPPADVQFTDKVRRRWSGDSSTRAGATRTSSPPPTSCAPQRGSYPTGWGSARSNSRDPVATIGGGDLPAPRLKAPTALEPICSADRLRSGAHATAARTATWCARSGGRFSTRPTSCASPATSGGRGRCWSGRYDAGAAVIPYGGGTSVVGGVEPAGGERYRGRRVDRSEQLDRVLEIDPDLAAPRGSRRARPARRSRSSSARTASRCAIFRSRSSSRRSADGSRRARAATSRRSTRTSTTSSSRCAW